MDRQKIIDSLNSDRKATLPAWLWLVILVAIVAFGFWAGARW